VYYSDRDHEVEMLLCWIPPSKFDDVAVDQAAADRLRRHYPSGLEVRVEPEELKAEGIKLEAAPDDLAKTYGAFRERNALHESGMVIGQMLERSAQARQQGAGIEELMDLAGELELSMPPEAPGAPPGPVRRISELPEMVGDEDPVEAFQRLSVRQHRPSEQEGR
jgi:hypothetical protein